MGTLLPVTENQTSGKYGFERAAAAKMALPDQWKGMTKGTRVWVRSPEEGWRQGTLAAAPPAAGAATTASCSVALDSDLGEGAGPVVAVPLADLAPANPTLLDGARCGRPVRGRTLFTLLASRLHAAAQSPPG